MSAGSGVRAYFSRYAYAAKKRGIGFFLTMRDFADLWGLSCHYCGDQVDKIGIDRLDGSGDYHRDNIVACCGRCNWMKREMTSDEFILRCRRVVEHQFTMGQNEL